MSNSTQRKKVFYLTFSYYPSGVFKSQIFDVIKLLREISDKDIRLICFFSVRVYFKCRKWVKKDMPDAIVLPIIFGMKKWEKHSLLLNLFARKTDSFIGRNPMGSKVALNFSPNVIYDGRSALKGEIEEYDMAMKDQLNQSFIRAEEFVVKHARHRLAVSNELVKFWRNDYNYLGDEHTVIPCSLAYSHNQPLPLRDENPRVRLLFSGGGSPWQDQQAKNQWICDLLENREDVEFIFLSKSDEFINSLVNRFPDRVVQKWLEPEEVFEELSKADYGILLREDNLTNRVSSPVKFAEYLNAGLNVIISSCIHDFAKFVVSHSCGIVVEKPSVNISLKALSQEERLRNRQLADTYLSKHSTIIQEKYLSLLNSIDQKT